jgi:hypothetical protein
VIRVFDDFESLEGVDRTRFGSYMHAMFRTIENVYYQHLEGHLDPRALADVNGDKPGNVVVEIPAKPQWCELRQIVFSWTQAPFPFRVRSGRKLKITQPTIITVIGKAFFDIGHAPADHSNRRRDLEGYAAWDIHPVMKLDVQ